jgi:hypothetical protein
MAAFGFPMPTVARKSSDASFPCQNQGCGCSTADQCAQNCCCSKPKPARPESCSDCAHDAPPSEADDPPADEQPATPDNVQWVIGVQALKCQGLSTTWVTTGAAVPPMPPLVWRPQGDFRGCLSIAHDSPRVFFVTPPDPPPRDLPTSS